MTSRLIVAVSTKWSSVRNSSTEYRLRLIADRSLSKEIESLSAGIPRWVFLSHCPSGVVSRWSRRLDLPKKRTSIPLASPCSYADCIKAAFGCLFVQNVNMNSAVLSCARIAAADLAAFIRSPSSDSLYFFPDEQVWSNNSFRSSFSTASVEKPAITYRGGFIPGTLQKPSSGFLMVLPSALTPKCSIRA